MARRNTLNDSLDTTASKGLDSPFSKKHIQEEVADKASILSLDPSTSEENLSSAEDSDILALVDVDENSFPEEELEEPSSDDLLDYPKDISLSPTKGLTRFDPLTRYVQEIRKYPLLTREEEHKLAVLFLKTRNKEIARRLITSNLRLVVKIAHEYRRAYGQLLDLVQEGNLGLLQAVEKYDPHRGVKLSSYAAWWIRAYMLRFIINNWRLVKIGTTQTQRKLFFNLNKEKEKLEAAGFVATSKALASALSVPERDIIDMQLRLGAGEFSIDAPIKGDEDAGGVKGDLIESKTEERPDVLFEGQEFRSLLKQKLDTFEKTLEGRERTLFRDRLIAEQPLTLQEVGDKYKISRERARQVEARLLSRLKVYLQRELGDEVQIAMGLDS